MTPRDIFLGETASWATRRGTLVGAGALLSGGAEAWAQASVTPDAFIAWARGAAQPVTDEGLVALAGNARVIGFAEFLHGGHEPLVTRNRLIRAMAERGLIQAVALETGFIEALRLNAYVLGDPGDPVAIAHDYFTWTFGDLGENIELLRWLREFNARPGARKVHFFGVDVPGGKGLTLGSLSLGVRDAMAALARLPSAEAASLRTSLEPYATSFDPPAYFALSPDQRLRFIAVCDALAAFLSRRQGELAAVTSPAEAAVSLQEAVVLRQGAELYRVWPLDNQGGTSAKGMLGTVEVRDAALADNLLWLLRFLGPQSRVLAFAATGHLVASTSASSPPPGIPRWWSSMGQRLRERLGSEYTVIFTGAVEGLPNTPWAGKAQPGTLAGALAMVSPDPFVLDLKAAPSDPWLDRAQELGATLMNGMRARPKDAFDSVVFFPKVTVAEGLAGVH